MNAAELLTLRDHVTEAGSILRAYLPEATDEGTPLDCTLPSHRRAIEALRAGHGATYGLRLASAQDGQPLAQPDPETPAGRALLRLIDDLAGSIRSAAH